MSRTRPTVLLLETILRYERSKTGAKLTWEDIKTVNVNLHTCMEKIRTMPDSDLEYLDEKFVTFLSDGKEYELVPNGKNILVTPKNKSLYIELTKNVHLAQLERPFRLIRDGFRFMAPEHYTMMHSPETLEKELCGMNYVDIHALKQITVYGSFPNSNSPDHPAIAMFWKVLESFTQEQLSGYLKYVWGRSRLSHSMGDKHTVTYKKGDSGIPEAHTCFFEVDIGDYRSAEDLKRKLLYGMENCKEIAEPSRAYTLSSDFGLE